MSQAINSSADGSHGYVAFYNGKRADVWANSSSEATDRARVFFKPPKSKKYDVFVVLAEKNGEQVVHSAVN